MQSHNSSTFILEYPLAFHIEKINTQTTRSRSRNINIYFGPLANLQISRVLSHIVSYRLVEHVDVVATALVGQRSDAEVRARKARFAANGEHILIDERRVLCIPGDVVAIDLVCVGHLGVEVVRVAQTG